MIDDTKPKDKYDKFDAINNPGMHAVLTGNPGVGFRAVGPFATASGAIGWAMGNCTQEWWPIPLESTEGFEP